MARRLTTFSKLIITLLVVAAIFFGGKWIMDNTGLGDKVDQLQENAGSKSTNTSPSSSSTKNSSSSNSADVIKIGVVTWGGYAGGQYFNEGFEANKNSRFYKDYGFQVEFLIACLFPINWIPICELVWCR